MGSDLEELDSVMDGLVVEVEHYWSADAVTRLIEDPSLSPRVRRCVDSLSNPALQAAVYQVLICAVHQVAERAELDEFEEVERASTAGSAREADV